MICAAVACLNAACWSIITPPFQVPDEPSHFSYTQELAESEVLPQRGFGNDSETLSVALTDLHWGSVRFHPEGHTIVASAEQRQLQRDLSRNLQRQGGGRPGVSASQPPLYYVLEMVPYGFGLVGTLLDRLELMRLLSALFGGLTALFVFLFVRESLPRVQWAWTVGGLGIALMPLLGFMSGGVNPDCMLFAVCAAVFFCLARAFRVGLTRRLAIAIGTLIAIGSLTKLNFIGLAPGMILGLIVLTVRSARTHGRAAALGSLAIAVGIAVSPVCLYLVVNVLSGHAGFGIASNAIQSTTGKGSILEEISYIWQFYLPRLPGMTRNWFPGLLTIRDLWFNRSVGLYGWLDTSFPVWVQNVALIPAVIIAVLCIRALVAARATLRSRLAELSVYAVISIGIMALVGADSYVNLSAEFGSYAQPRYLLPLLPLLAAVLVLAARGAGRRWGPVVGALIVVTFVAHDIFSQLLVIGRYYS
jgi:4-amino-4-deoxy-L-arabinose transferase-like glycosyltransferase